MAAGSLDDEHEPANSFSESWLTLREPADHAARNVKLTAQLAAWAMKLERANIVELGAGTGSNLRYLMPHLGHRQQWLLVDNDANLVDQLPRLLQSWADSHGAQLLVEDSRLNVLHENFTASITTKVLNLATQLDQIPMSNINLLTASALLDLTSASWLDTLADLCVSRACACLFTLNYDGRIQWQPELDNDGEIRSLLNQHQLSDKGFGQALGPEAGHHFAQALREKGRQVESSRSDWSIATDSQALQHAIVEGWALAAIEQDSDSRSRIQQWEASRVKAISQGASSLTVGHTDVLSMK